MSLAPVIFSVLALVFLGLMIRDRIRGGPKPTPARRAWRRIFIIFALVALGLFLLETLQGR